MGGESFRWLDSQKSKSVVFVGFGSYGKQTKEQVHELAYGLELSGLPFVWALRKPAWEVDDDEALPDGLVDTRQDAWSRDGMDGLGPADGEILAHPSI